MKSSWSPDLTEIRICDLPAKTLAEFNAFLDKYSNRSALPVKDAQPYSMVCKPGYKQRSYSFLYMPKRE